LRTEGPIVPWGVGESTRGFWSAWSDRVHVKALLLQVEIAESREGVVESTSVSHCRVFASARCLGQFVPPAPTRRPCANTRISALYPITARGHFPPIPSRTPLDGAPPPVSSSPACFTTKRSFSLPRSLQAPPQQCLSRRPQAWSHGACSFALWMVPHRA